jgi:hypothetical protein
VGAVLTPGQPDWRWRIVNNAGEIVEESHEGFPSMAVAIAHGTKRLNAMSEMDKPQRPARTR